MFNKKMREEIRSLTSRVAKMEAMLCEALSVRNAENRQFNKGYAESIQSLVSNWIVMPILNEFDDIVKLDSKFFENYRKNTIYFINDAYIVNKIDRNGDISLSATLSLFPLDKCSVRDLDSNICPIQNVANDCRILHLHSGQKLQGLLDTLNENIIQDKAIVFSLLKDRAD